MVRLPWLNCSYEQTPCDLFSVVEAVNTDVLSCCFLSLVREKATEKIGHNIFLPFSSYFGIMSLCLFIIIESYWMTLRKGEDTLI